PTVIELEFVVYDRWGNSVYSTNSMDNGWDGIVDGRTGASGVYIYTLIALTEKGEDIQRTGNITLVR
ncbi:MAG: gliding motility-associated C-terminal domain-containing protein, partial [Flavobacteriales bacterium]